MTSKRYCGSEYKGPLQAQRTLEYILVETVALHLHRSPVTNVCFSHACSCRTSLHCLDVIYTACKHTHLFRCSFIPNFPDSQTPRESSATSITTKGTTKSTDIGKRPARAGAICWISLVFVLCSPTILPAPSPRRDSRAKHNGYRNKHVN